MHAATKMLLSLKTIPPLTWLKYPPEILPQHQDWAQCTALVAAAEVGPHRAGVGVGGRCGCRGEWHYHKCHIAKVLLN